MLGLSWPLWMNGNNWPRIPWIAAWPEAGPLLSSTRLVVLVGSLCWVASGHGGRGGWLTSCATFCWSLLEDQNRLQPWVQQYLVIACGMIVLRPGRALDLARWDAVVVYAASGLSKVDVAFVDELGDIFLVTLGHLLGLTPESWPSTVRLLAILAMPVGEVILAIAMIVPGTRKLGLAGSVVQHLTTIAILGPWALDHSTIVLVWNAAMIRENWILFRQDWQVEGGSILAAGVVVMVLVIGERWGLIDSWPAHALYASHAERGIIRWPETAVLPARIVSWVGPPDGTGWRRLDLTGWSRAECGVPVYPQNRMVCGLAEALVTRYRPLAGLPFQVIFYGRSGIARQSIRSRVECVDLPSLQHRGDRFWINAHPTRGYGRGSG